jgi:chitinase
MRRLGRLGVAMAILGVLAAAAPLAAAADDRGAVVAGYFASWDIYGRNYHPRDIPADKVTHLLYAFATPTADGACVPADSWADYQRPYPAEESVDGVADDAANPDQHLFGNFNQLRKLKAAHPGLKLLISVGGWTLSTYFSDVAATQAAREKFARSCIDTFIRGDLPSGGWPTQAGGPGAAAGLFSGIDIDWEYPVCCGNFGNHNRPEDRHNATLLFQEFRKQLDRLGRQTDKRYLLTAALPAGNVRSSGSFELPEVAKPLDWINLLTYDFHGPWDTWTDFNSPFGLDAAGLTPPDLEPFWNTVGTVEYYLSKRVPAGKLVVGIPFYARQYIRVPNVNRGLYQPFDNTGLDPNTLQWDVTPTPTYHDLVDVARIVTAGKSAKGLGGYARYWNERAGEPWLYNPASARFGQTVGVFISYDDPRSVAERARYVEARNLRGAMFWEVSQDDDAHDLVGALSLLLDDDED